MNFFIIAEVAFVALGDLLLRSARCCHGGSIIKERHERVPRREHQEQERKRHMHEEPAVQPMLNLGLQIEQAALVTPCLYFVHAWMLAFRDAKPDKTKGVFGKSRMAESEFLAALGRQI